MYVIFKTNHVKKSDPKPLGSYLALEDAQDDIDFYVREAFGNVLVKAEQLTERYGPNVGICLDVDDVDILDASVLKPKNEVVGEATLVPRTGAAPVEEEEKPEMQSEAEVHEEEDEEEDLESMSEGEEDSSDEEEEEEEEEEQAKEEEKRDLGSHFICKHAMVYRDEAQNSVDIVKLTERTERRFFFFTKKVVVPEPLISFHIAQVPMNNEYGSDDDDNVEPEAPQAVRNTIAEQKEELLSSMIEYDA